MPEPRERGRLEALGCLVSQKVADFSGHPYVQIGFVLVCLAWFALELRVDIFTATLSILAITLSQMVLNRQNEREKEAHRRDLALHAKLDELVHASRRARDEVAGIEELEEDEIQAVRAAAPKPPEPMRRPLAQPRSPARAAPSLAKRAAR